jgi:hypothetical protein
MSIIETTMLQMKLEEAERAARMMERQLRKFLAGALCAECSEPLGEDREIVMDDDERTIHKECSASEEERDAGS